MNELKTGKVYRSPRRLGSVTIPKEVRAARNDYDLARSELQNTIAANHRAMREFRLKGGSEEKRQYDQTRTEHKVALERVRTTRNRFYQLWNEWEDKLDSEQNG